MAKKKESQELASVKEKIKKLYADFGRCIVVRPDITLDEALDLYERALKIFIEMLKISIEERELE